MYHKLITKYFVQFIIVLIIALTSGCSALKTGEAQLYTSESKSVTYTGRIDFSNPGIARMSGAGSYMEFGFRGTYCDVVLNDEGLYGGHGYISIEIDGQYRERIKITKDKKQYRIAEGLEDTFHQVLLCKATEAANGYIDVEGIICSNLQPVENVNSRKIEFIGNSITCGMGNDFTGLPCGSGQWYDQHNAYWSYAPISARALNADWLLSSVSGIGIYRNWNSPGPVMPDVYDNLFLNTDSTTSWNPKTFDADLISICLGTNDFSNGDGSYDRGPIDSSKYVNAYVKFIKHLRKCNTEAQIVCLTSPMISGPLGKRLKSFIQEVVNLIRSDGDEKIQLFEFSGSFNAGCSGHPDIDEHKDIASQVIPFYKQVMNW